MPERKTVDRPHEPSVANGQKRGSGRGGLAFLRAVFLGDPDSPGLSDEGYCLAPSRHTCRAILGNLEARMEA